MIQMKMEKRTPMALLMQVTVSIIQAEYQKKYRKTDCIGQNE